MVHAICPNLPEITLPRVVRISIPIVSAIVAGYIQHEGIELILNIGKSIDVPSSALAYPMLATSLALAYLTAKTTKTFSKSSMGGAILGASIGSIKHLAWSSIQSGGLFNNSGSFGSYVNLTSAFLLAPILGAAMANISEIKVGLNFLFLEIPRWLFEWS